MTYIVHKMLLKASEAAFNIDADKAINEAKEIHYFYNADGTVAVFSIIDDKKGAQKITEKLKKYNEDFTKAKYKMVSECVNYMNDIYNGVKAQPKDEEVFNYGV